MSKIAPRPKTDTNGTASKKPSQELDRLADTFINKGGKSIGHKSAPLSTRGRTSDQSDPDAKIGITVKLLVSERDEINQRRSARPIRSQVSLHDWIIEAVQEKLKREAQ